MIMPVIIAATLTLAEIGNPYFGLERLGLSAIFIAYLIFDRVYFLRKIITQFEQQEKLLIRLTAKISKNG